MSKKLPPKECYVNLYEYEVKRGMPVLEDGPHSYVDKDKALTEAVADIDALFKFDCDGDSGDMVITYKTV